MDKYGSNPVKGSVAEGANGATNEEGTGTGGGGSDDANDVDIDCPKVVDERNECSKKFGSINIPLAWIESNRDNGDGPNGIIESTCRLPPLQSRDSDVSTSFNKRRTSDKSSDAIAEECDGTWSQFGKEITFCEVLNVEFDVWTGRLDNPSECQNDIRPLGLGSCVSPTSESELALFASRASIEKRNILLNAQKNSDSDNG